MSLTAASLIGCGSNIAQISGRAEYEDGSPIVGAVRVVNFSPTESTTAKVRQSASGRIDKDGNFTMRTRKPGDGVHKGQYAVTFTVLDKPIMGNLLIPVQYSLPGNTPFTIDVTEDRDDLLYQLKKLE